MRHYNLDFNMTDEDFYLEFSEYGLHIGRNSASERDDEVNCPPVPAPRMSRDDKLDETIVLSQRDYRALLYCNIFSQIKEEFQETLDLKLAKDISGVGGNISLTGIRANVEEARSKINDTIKNLKSEDLPDIGKRSDFILSHLKAAYDDGSGVLKNIQSSLSEKKVYVSLQIEDNKAVLVFLEPSEKDKIKNALMQIVEQKTVEVEEGFPEIVKSLEWDLLKRRTCAFSSIAVYENADSSTIDIVGLQGSLDKAHQDISEYILDETYVTRWFAEREVVIKHLEKYNTFNKSEFVFKRNPPRIQITGKNKQVNAAGTILRKVVKKLILKEMTCSQSDYWAEYFRSDRGRIRITTIGENNRSIGVVDPQNVNTPFKETKFQKEPPFSRRKIKKKLHVVNGDITTMIVDVMVTSTTTYSFSSCQGSAISKALLKQAGVGLQRACEAKCNDQLSDGNVVATPGFKLPCNEVYHVLLPFYCSENDTRTLRTAIRTCLNMAESSSYSSIAFPTLGAGGFGFPIDVVLSTLQKEVNRNHGINLCNVFLVLFNQNNDITTGMISVDQKIVGDSIGKSLLSTGLDPVRILFCSASNANIDKAFVAVQHILEEITTEKVFEDDVIEYLTLYEHEELHKTRKDYNVVVVIKYVRLQTDVLEASHKVIEIILKLQKIRLCSEYVSWTYLGESGPEVKFSVQANYELETAYKKNKKGRTSVQAGFLGFIHSVGFADMESRVFCTTYKIKRILLFSMTESFPETWEHMKGEMYKKVRVLPFSAEYRQVLQKYKKTLDITPVKLMRIQNPTLWNQFISQKQMVEKRLKSKDVTRQLFHGTDAATCEAILKHGFDRHRAGKNGAVYGHHGVYFAQNADFSECYARSDAEGNKWMFLAEVITGVFCQGTRETYMAPLQMDGTPYDCVVDNPSNPTIFVVFRDASVYPAYLLTYKD